MKQQEQQEFFIQIMFITNIAFFIICSIVLTPLYFNINASREVISTDLEVLNSTLDRLNFTLNTSAGIVHQDIKSVQKNIASIVETLDKASSIEAHKKPDPKICLPPNGYPVSYPFVHRRLMYTTGKNLVLFFCCSRSKFSSIPV